MSGANYKRNVAINSESKLDIINQSLARSVNVSNAEHPDSDTLHRNNCKRLVNNLKLSAFLRFVWIASNVLKDLNEENK
jgi:hypothetical protein